MIFWTVANVVSAGLACWTVAYMLIRHRGALTLPERLSMGVVAGCMALRTGPILGKAMATTSPFDDWATGLMHIALAVLLICWAARLEGVAVLPKNR